MTQLKCNCCVNIATDDEMLMNHSVGEQAVAWHTDIVKLVSRFSVLHFLATATAAAKTNFSMYVHQP